MIIAVLLYSAIAPVFDHHVAERRPEHGHLYPSGILSAHKHLAQDSHRHGSQHSGLIESGENDESNGVIVLPADDFAVVGSSLFLIHTAIIARLLVDNDGFVIKGTQKAKWAVLRNIPLPDTPPPRYLS